MISRLIKSIYWIIEYNDKKVDLKMLHFDDIEIGQRLQFGSYKLEKEEIISFSRQWDPQPFHIDEMAAKNSVFGGITASSLHIFAICTKLFALSEPKLAILAMLGKDEVRFHNPARPGDILSYQAQCIDKRESPSKPNRGIMQLKDLVTTNKGSVVLTQTVTLMMAKKPSLQD